MSASLNHHAIYASMNQDYELCEQMLAKLQVEKFALENSDIDLLEQIISEKAAILQKLAETQNIRDQELENLGLDIGFRGLKVLFTQTQNTASTEQLALIKKLEELLHRISEISYVNSMLVHHSYNQTNKILDIMLDRNTNQTTTYNKNGFTNISINIISTNTKV